MSIAAYAILMSIVTVMRYNTFRTLAFDLGIFNQAFSTALEGRLFYETPDIHVVPSGSFLGVHFNLIMFLLLPIYAIAPRPETLLVLQTCVIALGALPIYLIARHLLGPGRSSLLLSGLYLVNPGTLSLNFYDFHLEAFLPFFVGMGYYSYLKGHWKRYGLFFLLSIVTIDFASVLTGSIALTHLIRHVSVRSMLDRYGRRTVRVQTNLDSRRILTLLATLVLSVFSLFTILSASAYFAGSGRPVSTTLLDFLRFGSPPEHWVLRASFWILLLASLMFLPLLAVREFIAPLPWFVITLLPVPVSWYLIGYQYAGAFVAPFLLIAAARGYVRVRSPRRGQAILAGAIIVSAALTPLNPLTHGLVPGIAYEQGLPIPTAHDTILHAVIALIPPEASVLTQNDLFPQVSGRSGAYLYLPTGNEVIDFVLADTRTSAYSLPVWGRVPLSTTLPQVMSTGNYGIVALSDGIVLVRRGYVGSMIIAGPTEYRYGHRDLFRLSGASAPDPTSEGGTVFFYHASAASPTAFWAGPYARLPPGHYRASFYLKAGEAHTGSITLAISHSIDATSVQDIASRTLDTSFFSAPNVWQPAEVPFTLSYSVAGTGSIEFRSTSVQGGPFSFDFVVVTLVGPL